MHMDKFNNFFNIINFLKIIKNHNKIYIHLNDIFYK